MTAVARHAAVAVLAMLALGAPGCSKRAPGTCRDDVDCPPGFDCRSGGCVRRERLTFAAGGAAVAPVEEPAVEAPPPPAPRDATAPASPVPARPVAKPKAAPPVEPPVPPARPEQRLPEWKQRLKNS